jgi:nucleotide-binding universal stress UspA family protein
MQMFEKVLAALDFSPDSQQILDRISEIPGISEVVLLHVVDVGRPKRLEWTDGQLHIENTKLLMQQKKEYLEQQGLVVRVHVDVIVNAVTQGTVSQAILDIAEEEKVSLVVIGARGINPIQELLLGSVSSSVIRHGTTNVLVLHRDPAREVTDASLAPGQTLFSNVLVPTDFSEPAGEALALVKTIPGLQNVVLLHVVSRAESQQGIDVAVTEAQARLFELQKEFSVAGVGVTTHVRVGDPTEMILSVAEVDDVSLIAMSAYGTDRLRTFLLGSTTFAVVRRTKKPMLILRTGQET